MIPDTGQAAHDLVREAERIDRDLRAIRRRMWQPFAADMAQLPLTMPQVQTLHELGKEEGLSLTTLSKRLGLAHSSVSGIVDRLERQHLVRRTEHPTDRRRTQIVLADRVRAYVQDTVPHRRLGPLIAAMERLSPDERARVADAVCLLRRHLEDVAGREAR